MVVLFMELTVRESNHDEASSRDRDLSELETKIQMRRSKGKPDVPQGRARTSGVTALARIRDLSATNLHAIIANDLYTARARR